MARLTTIYQTLEDRGNDDEIQTHGPYFCALKDDDGTFKTGAKEPWLGEGYYFWDTRIEDAEWWGKTIYEHNGKGYIVCQTQYDRFSPLFFDMVGDLSNFDEFFKCAQLAMKEKRIKRISFPAVLAWIKKRADFGYKAIRVVPFSESPKNAKVFFPGQQYSLRSFSRVQVCFFDKTLLIYPFKIVNKHSA